MHQKYVRLLYEVYSHLARTYVRLTTPCAFRNFANTQLGFVTGQLIANGVIAGTQKLDTHWAYSAPFAVQWVSQC
jgi:hypothetical protein